MNRLWIAATAVSAVLVGAAAAAALLTGEDGSAPEAQSISWRGCGSGVECGRLVVPLDHSDPRGRTIRLAVARRPAESPAERLGVLLFAPGGPGGPGTPLVVEHPEYFSSELRRRFDVVSWDPRGVSPGTRVDCPGDALDLVAGPDREPETASERALERRRARAFAEGCRRAAPGLLPNVSTVSSVRDLELLRRALGEDRLSLLGQSYGTAVASVYATLYPDHVRAAALDGAYDLSGSYTRLVAQATAAEERSLTTMLQQCAGDDRCPFHSGGDPFAALDRLLAKLDDEPLEEIGASVGRAEALAAIRFGVREERAWPELLFALSEARSGNPYPLAELTHPGYLANADSATAIFCLDRPRRAWDWGTDAKEELLAAAPRLGPLVLGSTFTVCGVWPADPDPPPRITAAGAPPVLVVGSTGDTATPLAASRDLARRLENAALLVVERNGHTAYGAYDPERRCATEIVDRYLLQLELPARGTMCT